MKHWIREKSAFVSNKKKKKIFHKIQIEKEKGKERKIDKVVNSIPCCLIMRICLTVSCNMAHLSGLTDNELMSLRLADINSANSSIYMFSCSRRRFSFRHLFLLIKRYKDKEN